MLYWMLQLHWEAASAQQHLEVDLRGNGHTQAITLETFPQGDFGEYQVAVGKASFGSEYFSAAGDVPKIHIVKLDEKDAAKQMMVTIAWAADCSFQFLSYDGASLDLLGTLESQHCLHEPEILGNGDVVMPYWKGFWTSRRVFRLSGEPKRLQPVEQAFYELDVDGVVSSRFPVYVEGSDEPAAYLDVGQRLSLKRFDTRTGRYQVWVDHRVKGWAQIDYDNVSGLPWAD